MFIRTGLTSLGLLLVASAPAYALFCTDDRGVTISFGVTIGEQFSESELNEFDLMELRQAGVDATRVERWNGCIRAFVRTPAGEEMQFFDPNTMLRVQ